MEAVNRIYSIKEQKEELVDKSTTREETDPSDK